MRNCGFLRLIPLLAWATLGLAASPARSAESVADFYRGKQLVFYVRAAPGGNYDLYTRLLGEYMSRYLPGHPTSVAFNMPGGGGLVALNYVANVAPRDGTVLTIITQTFPMDQALGLDKNLKVDLRKLNWIGEMSTSEELFVTAKNSLTKTLGDAKRRTTLMAATGEGSITTLLAALYNHALGTRFKVIYGYPSGPAMSLAVERGEVEGRSTSNPSTLARSLTQARASFNFLIQAGLRKAPGFEDVPLLNDLAAGNLQRRVFKFVSEGVSIARPVVAAPGIPPERAAALRLAFDKAMRDPGLLADARREGLQISALDGGELGELATDLIDSPSDLRAEIAEELGAKPKSSSAHSH